MQGIADSDEGTRTMKQTTLGSTDLTPKTKVTRRTRFPAEMDALIPRSCLLAAI